MASSEFKDNLQSTLNAPTNHRYFWTWTTAISMFGYAIVGLITYGRSIFLDFGRLDDYVAVGQQKQDALFALRDQWLQAGRVIPSVVGVWLFSVVGSVGDLVLPRIVSTLMVSMGGALTALLVLRMIPRKWPLPAMLLAASAGFIAMSTTSGPNAATWAIQAIQLVAFPTALAAGVVATSERPILGVNWAVMAGALIIISVFSYQQYAMLAVMPTLLWSSTRWARRQAPHWGRAAIVAIMCTAALGANFLLIKVIGGGAGDRAFRYPLSKNIEWFLGIFLPRTVDVFVPSSPRRAAVSTVLLVILLAIPLLAGIRYLALSLAVLISWMACSLVAFPTELWASYRLIHPAQLALWAGASVGAAVSLIDSGAKHKLRLRVAATVFVLISLFSLTVAGYRAYTYLAWPNSIDWASTKCTIANAGTISVNSVIVATDWSASRSAVISYDEYGVIGSAVEPVLSHMVGLAQYELRVDDAVPGVPKIVPYDNAIGLTVPGMLRITQDICGTFDN